MNKKGKIILVSVLATTLVAGAAYAKRDGFMHGRMISHISDRLELDSNQEKALEDLATQFKSSMQNVAGDRQAAKEKLTGLITADTFDQGAALEMINTRADAMRENAPALVATAAVFLDGLDAEQKAELGEAMEKMKKRKGHRGKGKHSESDLDE